MKKVVVGTLMAGLMVSGLVGQINAAEEETPTPTAPAVAPAENVTPEQPAPAPVTPEPPSTAPASIEKLKAKVDEINASSGTGTKMTDVVKLYKAGVKTGVIETYVRNSRIPAPTPEDLVYLQEQGVPEEIVKALIEHGQSMANSSGTAVGAPPPTDSSQVTQPGATYNNYVYNSPAQMPSAATYPAQMPSIVRYPDYTSTAYQNNSSLLIIPYNPYRNWDQSYYAPPFWGNYYYSSPWYSPWSYGCAPYRPYYNSYYSFGRPYYGGHYRGGYYHGGLHGYRR